MIYMYGLSRNLKEEMINYHNAIKVINQYFLALLLDV